MSGDAAGEMRYVVYGAGAVGCVIGAALHRVGRKVVLIGRGRHLEAIRRGGLSVESPWSAGTYRLPAAASPRELAIGDTDVVILAMKGQDTEQALRTLRDAACAEPAVACAQNGVENERAASRLFSRVYGIVTLLPATLLEPGRVLDAGGPGTGILDIGRFPRGVDPTAVRIAADLTEAGFGSDAVEDVMRWKYAKLLQSVRGVAEALCRPGEGRRRIAEMAGDEAERCLRAAGIIWAPLQEMRERRAGGAALPRQSAGKDGRGRASLWQSLARNAGSVETDYFNGEIVLLGRLHGVQCPANEVLQDVAREMAQSGIGPEGRDAGEILERIGKRAQSHGPASAPANVGNAAESTAGQARVAGR